MRRSVLGMGLVVAAASAFSVAIERDAAACGGCFHPPTQTASDITDERMLLAVSPTQTTLYDQIQYTGNPTSFAWVLPIHGTVTVGLSADVLFDSVDAVTATTIQAPAANCPAPPPDCGGGGAFPSAGAGATLSADGGASDGVTVIKAENVGPYATVQLSATDPNALNNWLAANGFDVPAAVQPVVDEYVKEGFDFLAMKLLPNVGIQAMRPVRVSMPGASVSLPLRMAAIGTGTTVGITIWVVADGRYEPQNFPFFHIEDSALIWDFATSSSNYTTLRAQNEAALNGKGWELESSIDLNEQLITSVVLSGGIYNQFGGPTGYISDPSIDYLPVGNPDGGADDAGPSETADQVRTDDVTALFAGMPGPTVRVTRMRSDISHAAMTTDFVLAASTDQSELSNVRTVTQSVNLTCPIYNNCSIVGSGPPSQAAAGSGTSSVGASTTGIGGATTYTTRGGGCVAAPETNDGPGMRFGVLGGMLGLAIVRLVRTRRRSSRTAKK